MFVFCIGIVIVNDLLFILPVFPLTLFWGTNKLIDTHMAMKFKLKLPDNGSFDF